MNKSEHGNMMLERENVEYKRHLNRLPNFFIFPSSAAAPVVIIVDHHRATESEKCSLASVMTKSTVGVRKVGNGRKNMNNVITVSSSFPCGLRCRIRERRSSAECKCC